MSETQPREILTAEKRAQRKSIVTLHRTVLQDASKHLNQQLTIPLETYTMAPPKPKSSSQNFPKKLRVTSIYLSDMQRNFGDHVYRGTLLNLTLIDDPIFGQSSANFIAEDYNKDVIRLSLACRQHPILGKLVFGTKIGIVNPWFRLAADGIPVIRVEDLSMIFIFGRKKDMCRYCGAENTKWACVNCDKVYCNRDCQVKDWRFMNHRMVCTGQYNLLRVGGALVIFGLYLFWNFVFD